MSMRISNLKAFNVDILVALRCLCMVFVQLRNSELFVSQYFPVVFFTLF